MIMVHYRTWNEFAMRRPAIPCRLAHQPSLIEKLIARQRQILVPRRAVHAKRKRRAALPVGRGSPGPQPRRNGRLDQAASVTAILPGKIAIPVLPSRGDAGLHGGFPGQAEIGDRNTLIASRLVPAHLAARRPVCEGIELFDIAEPIASLPFNPGAQTGLHRSLMRIERP